MSLTLNSQQLAEKQDSIRRAIADLLEMGNAAGAASLAQKHHDILHPNIPFGSVDWLNRFITQDAAMEKVKNRVGMLANHSETVLLEGPSGTGKELLARALHGNRDKDKFCAVNCAALPEHLMESELFGHKKGSFTGATEDKLGLFEVAETLFLDEVGELPPLLQAKLLRVLQEKSIRRVGDNSQREIKCRIVCATLKNLKDMVEQRMFREDLYYRISTFSYHLTPLSERPKDIPLITNHIAVHLEIEKKVPNDKKWPRDFEIKPTLLPGNVRSIQGIVLNYLIFGELPSDTLIN